MTTPYTFRIISYHHFVPPSCMVAPVRDLGNKSVFSPSNTHSQQNFQLPTVFSSNYTGMDKFFAGPSPDNYDEVRGRTSSPNIQFSRNSLVSSTKSSVAYHERMERNNAMIEDVDMNDVSPELSYKMTQEKTSRVSKAADTNNNAAPTNLQRGPHEYPNMSPAHVDDTVINISLPYDPNAPTEPDLWDGSFHPISLHGSMEHLASDAKNIRDSLNFMAKYILNKQVDPARSNDLDDFKGIGEAVWNLVSSVYQSKWDSLITDKNNKSLRKK